MNAFEIYGQSAAVTLLESSITSSKLHHAYLFEGPASVGKKTLATQLATIVTAPDADELCRKRISAGEYPDVWILEVKPTEISSNGDIVSTDTSSRGSPTTVIGKDVIEDVQNKANNTPFEGKANVFIFDIADHLSYQASIRILKLLEEPPPNVLLLLLSENPDAILPTVRSRCVSIKMQTMAVKDLEQVLHQELGYNLEESKNVARLSDGRIGWALNALNDQSFLAERHQQIERLVGIVKGDLKAKFDYAAELSRPTRNRSEIQNELRMWLSWFRDVMMVQNNLPLNLTNIAWQSTVQLHASSTTKLEVLEASKAILKTSNLIEKNVNRRILFEALMLQLPSLTNKQV